MSIIKHIKEWNEVIKKEKFITQKSFKKEEPEIRVAFFDTETTGLNVDPEKFKEDNPNRSKVIELAYRVAGFNSKFEMVSLEDGVDLFQEEEISEKITKLTGIKPEDVKGKSIDWKKVQSDFDSCDYCVAHNANFDSNVLHFVLKLPKTLCSLRDFNWNNYDLYNHKQEILALAAGFHYEAHRAINDVDSLIKIVSHFNCLPEMIKNANKQTLRIKGWGGYKFKDFLKLEMKYKPNKIGKDFFWEARLTKEEMDKHIEIIKKKFKELREYDNQEIGIIILD